jgi:tripeptidyl-peptidase I
MTLPVRVATPQKDVHVGHGLLIEISNTKSKNYGKYLSAKEVGDIFGPSNKSTSYIREWLHSSSIDLDRQSARHSWLKFNATIQELETLLLTEYHVYQHHETREEHIRCNEHHVPRAV